MPFFQQDSASAHIANHSTQYLQSVYGHTITMGWGPLCLLQRNLCTWFLLV